MASATLAYNGYPKFIEGLSIDGEAISRYAVDLVRATRPETANAPEMVKRYVKFGASVRATLFITLAAKARALMQGRYHVSREDIDALAKPVLRHRVLANYYAESDNLTVDDILDDLVQRSGAVVDQQV